MTNGPGLHFRQQLRAKFDQSLVEQNARPPSASHDSKWCNPFTATALNSVQSFEFVKCHFGMWRAVLMLWAMKCFGGHMTKIIEFYVPQSFRKASKWFPPVERGKVLAFPLAVRKSA